MLSQISHYACANSGDSNKIHQAMKFIKAGIYRVKGVLIDVDSNMPSLHGEEPKVDAKAKAAADHFLTSNYSLSRKHMVSKLVLLDTEVFAATIISQISHHSNGGDDVLQAVEFIKAGIYRGKDASMYFCNDDIRLHGEVSIMCWVSWTSVTSLTPYLMCRLRGPEPFFLPRPQFALLKKLVVHPDVLDAYYPDEERECSEGFRTGRIINFPATIMKDVASIHPDLEKFCVRDLPLALSSVETLLKLPTFFQKLNSVCMTNADHVIRLVQEMGQRLLVLGVIVGSEDTVGGVFSDKHLVLIGEHCPNLRNISVNLIGAECNQLTAAGLVPLVQ